jgi:hypothetical protein
MRVKNNNPTRHLIIKKRNKKTYAVKYVLIPKNMLQFSEIYKLKLHANLSNLYISKTSKTNILNTLC